MSEPDSDPEKRIALFQRKEVRRVIHIEGSKYGEFLQKQKNILPPDIWKGLSRYAVRF